MIKNGKLNDCIMIVALDIFRKWYYFEKRTYIFIFFWVWYI